MAVRQAYVHSELNGSLLPMKILSHFALFFSPKKINEIFSVQIVFGVFVLFCFFPSQNISCAFYSFNCSELSHSFLLSACKRGTYPTSLCRHGKSRRPCGALSVQKQALPTGWDNHPESLVNS